jgi:hypothetical protein
MVCVACSYQSGDEPSCNNALQPSATIGFRSTWRSGGEGKLKVNGVGRNRGRPIHGASRYRVAHRAPRYAGIG